MGKVKTRLAQEVGDHHALKIYQALLTHTRETALRVKSQRYLYYAPAPVQDEWSSSEFIKRSQVGVDLGERMMHAFQETSNNTEKVVIIGSDCPQLTPDIIDSAFDALEHNDVVIGPTFDGGYYLLGMKRVHEQLFRKINWSTEEVFNQTTSHADKSNLSYAILQKLSDVDYKADWTKYGWEL